MVTTREDSLASGYYYHIYSRSIAKYTVFNNPAEYTRIIQLIDLNRFKDFDYKFSRFKDLKQEAQYEIIERIKTLDNPLVEIIAYCIMPTHIHLLLKQIEDDGITLFMSRILNSYSKFFNSHHKRSGPLWSGRFKNVLARDDEQLLHLTRYIHLNPTSAGLIDKPEDWDYSSYQEYLSEPKTKSAVCKTSGLFDLNAKQYRKFVNDHKSHQRDLSLIKSTLIDNYTG